MKKLFKLVKIIKSPMYYYSFIYVYCIFDSYSNYNSRLINTTFAERFLATSAPEGYKGSEVDIHEL